MRKATARWTEGWYRAVTGTGSDVRTYLAGASSARWAARWSRAVMAWDDTSGYGALEADRAAITVDANAPRDDPRTVLLRTGSWSRERGPTGVRSSTLVWGTASPGSEDVASVAARP